MSGMGMTEEGRDRGYRNDWTGGVGWGTKHDTVEERGLYYSRLKGMERNGRQTEYTDR